MIPPGIPGQLLNCKELEVGYAGRTKLSLIKRLNLSLVSGDLLILKGRNGCGKTTLLRTVLGVHKHISGKVIMQARRPAFVSQAIKVDSFFPLDLYSYIKLGFVRWSVGNRDVLPDNSRDSNMRQILDLLELTDARHTRIAHLSAGQWQRAMLAQALISQPDLLIMDEPSSHLDDCSALLLIQILEDLSRRQKLGILLASHDERLQNLKFAKYYRISEQELQAE